MSNTPKDDFFSDIGLATTKDGAVVGAIFAIALLVGIIRVEMLSQKLAIWFLLAVGIVVTVNHVTRHRSYFSPPVDGFIIGFGLVFGILNLLFGHIP